MKVPAAGLTNHFSFSPLVLARNPPKTPGAFTALLLTGIIVARRILGVKMETEQNQCVFLQHSQFLAGRAVCHGLAMSTLVSRMIPQSGRFPFSLKLTSHLKVASVEFSHLYQILHCSSERAMSIFCPLHWDLALTSVSCSQRQN